MTNVIHNALTRLAASYRDAVAAPSGDAFTAAQAALCASLGEVHTALGDQISPWRVAFAEELRRQRAWDAVFAAYARVERAAGAPSLAQPRVGINKQPFHPAFSGEASPPGGHAR